jgi:TetR/AcrR family transcriptional regulator, mexJK operon transcriptional repressor
MITCRDGIFIKYKPMIKSGRPPKGQEFLSRDRLLDTALKLFSEHGYGDLSMETIARNAQVSMRTIYSHFGGKAGLFGAVIRRFSDHCVDYLPDHSEPRDALLAFAREFIYQLTRPEVVRLRTILIGESLRFPDLAAQFYAQGPQITQNALAAFFASKQQQGYFTHFEPSRLADQFLSSLRNEYFYKLQLGLESTPTDAEIASWVQQSVDFFLYGCVRTK